MWDKIKQIVSPIAPVLGGMIGGPVGAAAGTILKQTLLGDDKASDDDLLNALQGMTPEQQLALKQADNDYKLEMARLGVQQYQIDADDRASARQREKDMLASGIRDRTTPNLAYIVVIGFIAIAIYVLYLVKGGEINTEEGTIIGLLVGHFLSEVKQVLSYYFGSTHETKEKDRIIEKMTK